MALIDNWTRSTSRHRTLSSQLVEGYTTPFAVASPAMGHWGTCPPRLPTISPLVYFGVNLTANSKYCVVCEISWCRRQHSQQLTALSISTALVTKLLVIEQLLHPALKSTVSAPWPNFQLCPSSQQILATPLAIWTEDRLNWRNLNDLSTT